ncbi:FAD-dependent oxidoreductase [Teichococcus aestuarii]|uniref:FAD-dependent oxidoreductase n=1 Tax=Teichococcus aestuarii TaxID=568898 RepID=UPI003606CA1F
MDKHHRRPDAAVHPGYRRQVRGRLGAGAYSGDVSILRRFEPRVAEMVANEWAARYADRVILNCQIEAAGQQVVRDGTTTRGIVTPQGIIRCGQVVEASYTGDVLRAAGISWTWTREAASAAEPYGGWKLSYGYRATGVDMTGIPPAAFEKFGARVVSGISDLSLPATGSAVPGVMGYNIRNIMTDAPDRIRFEDLRPADYDRERYLLPFAVSVRFSNDQAIQDVIGFQDEEAGSLPNYAGDGSAIFNSNSAGVYNTNILAQDYPIATWARRREIERDVVNYNLGLYYFFATDSIVPESIRASFAAWGLSPREWIGSRYGTGVPHKVYDRQTIRMVNDAVMTEADVKVSYTAGAVPDPIGLFNYFIDRKVFNFVAWNTSGNLWTLAEEGGGVPNHDTATYAIPLRILLPRAAEATNVTVAWCVAVTDHVWSSLRMELNGGIQGEAAGVVAALAARRGVPVQSIPYADVRAALRSLGVTIR